MKYAVNLVVNDLIANIGKNKDESLFLINGFENLNFYADVAHELTTFAKSINKTITIKLAKSKWEQLKNKHNGEPCVHVMVQNDWISDKESTTHYRNLHTDDILVLMGTENEDDISGSLKDIYEIRCDKLISLIPKKNNRVLFSDIFDFHNVYFNDADKDVVNKLYKFLFDLVNPDICKFSKFWDDNASGVVTINDFIEIFYANLPIWGIPLQREKLPKPAYILSNRKNILRNAYSFINASPFKTFSKSVYKKYKTKLEKYNFEGKQYSATWDGWANQPITSYDDFTNIIMDFICGERSNSIKNKLLKLDYTIVDEILGFKVKETTDSIDTKRKIYGNPLMCFMTAYLKSLVAAKKNNSSIDSIEFEFTSAEIITSSTEDNSELTDVWRNICVHVNGALEQISEYGYAINQNYVSLTYSPASFFDIVNPNTTIVHQVGLNKKLHQISFNVISKVDDKKTIQQYVWLIEPNEAWLNSYGEIVNSNILTLPQSPIIPLSELKNISSLITKKSEEEFFDYLIEKCSLDFSCNLLTSGAHIDEFKNNQLYASFYELGRVFNNFACEMKVSGLYNTFSNKSGSANTLINNYKKLGDFISKKTFNENEYYILDLFIHAFNVERTAQSVINEKDIDCCIVPPWHPASIEKHKHQILFFLDGCFELWKSIDEKEDIKDITEGIIDLKLDELCQMCIFQNAVDVFVGANSTYFGTNASYGNYSIYTSKSFKFKNTLSDLVKKEFVFDDEFSNSTYSVMNEDSRMIYGVLANYIKAFPNSQDNLSLVFIDPSDLQPIISSIHKYIREFQKKHGEERELYINLQILVKPENKGGKNYITYWMNETFDVDSNVKIKTYLNEWKTKEELDRLLNENNDIVFVMDLLKVSDYEFINKIDYYKTNVSECYYPIVFRPSPSSVTTTKRRIELTQPQFAAASVHTQVVHYRKHLESPNTDFYFSVKTVDINEEIQKLVKELHSKSYWVVCIDASMDGKLLKDSTSTNEYSVIGFSTGKGKYGQYNITITARKSILKSIENNFSNRLAKMFNWNQNLVLQASKKCMDEAAKLDGISVLSASNHRDYNINEFMAYVLTSLRMNQKVNDNPLNIIVHLDSYKHWFDGSEDSRSIFDSDCSKSRPDFLVLSVDKDFHDKIKIKATVVECKIAKYANRDQHLQKAEYQVQHGIEILSNMFNPASTSIKRRYWFAQLYRALAFSQISFNDSSSEFNELANKLRGILNGNFDVEWNGEVLGYWLDMNGDNEVVETKSSNVVVNDIPQKRIQQLILGENATVQYVHIDESLLDDEEEYNTKADTQEKNMDIMMEESNNRTKISRKTNGITEKTTVVVEEPVTVTPIITEESKEDAITTIEPEITTEIKDSTTYDITDNNMNINLEDIRVLAGEERNGNKVYWEFGNKQLANRHLLITGTSGQGKTYCIQTLLYELSKHNVSSVIFDYTEGFRINQLEKEFVERMENRINQHVVKFAKVPINPFKRHFIEFDGMKFPEDDSDIAARFANIITHVYNFGDQQYATIFEAVRVGLSKYKDKMNMDRFREELENDKSSKFAQSVANKMKPFFYGIKFEEESSFDWKDIVYPSSSAATIFQLTMIDRDIQVIITELLLWDLWYFTLKNGSKDKPFVVVLDEAQNLSHKDKSPSCKILTEGRKFGWSAWFATQSLKVLADDEIVRLMQASFKLYFKPTDEEMPKISKQIDPTDSSAWLGPIKHLAKGQCITIGDRIRNDGSFGPVKPTVTSVTSFEKRK